VKSNFHIDLNSDRLAVLLGGLELPFSHCFDSLFIKAQVTTSGYANITRQTLWADDHI
jgi:hypothetical protein